jgi:uncharacterized protein YkwD
MVQFKSLAAALLLMAVTVSARAEVQFAIGEPAEGSTKSGIGQISGWAVSDREIISVEALIDGASLGLVPYGGSRLDVAAAFPGYPDSEFSGWSMKWNYSLHVPGEHLLTIVITEDDSTQTSRDVVFSTTRFHSEFIADPGAVRTAEAGVSSPEDGRLLLEGAEIDGESVNVELAWDKAAQQFLIDQITYPEAPRVNQAPEVNAGPDLQAYAGDVVTVRGSGADPDGFVSSRSWSRVSGAAVTLQGADLWTVQFVAPQAAGQVRLRLTVTDNEGMSASDDVVITFVEAPPPPPEPNQAPTADAGPDMMVQPGDAVSISGSGSDPDGVIVNWSWTQVSGTAVNLSGASNPNVGFTAPATAGDIRLRLTVTDDDGASDSDDVIVTVEADGPPDTTTGATLESMLAVINNARGQDRNCGSDHFSAQPPFSWSGALAGAAMEHSIDMARNAYFDHTSPDGRTIGDRLFPIWAGHYVGENIAGSSVNRSDAYVVDLWLNSPGHCALIMDPDFTHIGVGYGRNDENGYNLHHFWTLDFGG